MTPARCIVALALAAIASVIAVGDAASAEADPDAQWVRESLELMDQARRGAAPIDLPSAPSAEELARYRADVDAQVAASAPFLEPQGAVFEQTSPVPPPPQPARDAWYVFVSQSMPDEELRTAMAISSATQRLVLVFRGVRGDQTIMEFMARFQPMMLEFDPPPMLEIDPIRFQDAKVKSAPTLVFYRADQEIARVVGQLNPAWAERRLADGETGDFGTFGTTYPLAEIDLLLEQQRDLAAYDWDAAKARAMQRFFTRLPFVALDVATVERERFVDPTIEVTTDIRDHEGRVLVPQGTRVNPLELVPMTQKLVIFDGTSAAQLDFAKAQREPLAQRQVVFITTALDREAGMASLEAMAVALGAHVALLSRDVAERFHVERVPTVIDGAGAQFRVREFPVASGAEP